MVDLHKFQEAIKNYPNPFRLGTVVSATEVWEGVISDLPSLNKHIDTEVHQAIDEVRKKYNRTVGIAIKGDRGRGKSHAISRIRKKIEADRNAVFAYIPPCENTGNINSHVRLYVCESFKHQDESKVSQWQKLAAAAIKTLKNTDLAKEYQEYLKLCDHPDELRKLIRKNYRNKSELLSFFEQLTEDILENQSGINFDVLKAILISLLKNNAQANVALSWLEGQDHPDIKQLSLTPFEDREKNTKSIWMIEQVCKLAEVAQLPVVICFDQLDHVQPDYDTGDSGVQTIARCIDRIYTECSNVILLCCLISDTWREIEQMQSGIPDRVGERPVVAKYPNADQVIELVKSRLDWFYREAELSQSDYPFIYPFDENKVREIAKENPGVRDVMEWCAKNFVASDYNDTKDEPKSLEQDVSKVSLKPQQTIEITTPPDDKVAKLEDYFNELSEKAKISNQDDDELAAILKCSLLMLPEEGVDQVTVTQVNSVRKASKASLHLIVEGYDATAKKNIKIGLRISETQNGKSFNAVMKRLLDYQKYQLTRGCLVRSTPVPRSWKVGNQLKDKLEQKGGEVVTLDKKFMKPLIALHKIYQQARDYGFEGQEEVIGLVQKAKLVADNLIIREILSEGTTEVPPGS